MPTIDPNRELIYAAEIGDAESVAKLIVKGAEVNSRSRNGFTALQCAVKSNSIKTVAELLNCGADVTLKDHLGNSALHMAITIGSNEIAHLLVSKGADMLGRNRAGETPLDIAMLTRIRRIDETKPGQHGRKG
jgi:cytohesin